MRGAVKIARLVEIAQVGGEKQALARMLAKGLVFPGHQQNPAKRQQDNDQHHQRRHDPPRPGQIETAQTETLCGQPLADNPGHQKARNHEKDINPGKAATETRNIEVVEHHRNHRPGPQAINIATKAAATGNSRMTRHFEPQTKTHQAQYPINGRNGTYRSASQKRRYHTE